MTEVVRIPFHGREIHTVDIDGKPFIVLRPVVESIGLDYSSQIAKLRDRSWTNRRDIPTVAADGRTRLMAAVDVPTFLMWLATVNENKVAEGARPLLVAYQRESTEAVYGYWTQGGAINPRATDEQLDRIISRAKAQAEVVAALRGIVDAAWLDAKGRHILARAIGEEPEIDPATRPLTVGEYLADRGVAGSALRSLSTTFGKRVKALYRLRHDADPPKVDRFVDGALRQVAGYTERDRPLMDAAWEQLGTT